MFKRRWRRILVLVVVVLVVLVAVAPWLAGLSPVRRYVEGRLTEALGRDVSLGGIEASWTGGVAIDGMRVANRGGVFGSAPAVEAKRVEVNDALTDILFGNGPSHVVVEGLAVRVEEQAGGRTNLDDILPRPPKPRPPPPPGVKVRRRPRRAMQVTLKDATFTLRRLPARPQPHPIDPFEEDPVVLGADEGVVVLGVEALDLDLETGPDGTHARFTGGLVFNEERGRVDGDVRHDAEGTRGHVEATGLDLAWLAPLLGADLAGRVDLTVQGDERSGLDANARVEGLHLAGPRLPGLTEEWATVAVVAKRVDGEFTIEHAEVKTASDTIAVNASGAAAGFEAHTRLPLRHVFALTGDVPADGVATADVTGRIGDDSVDLAGTLALAGLVFSDPKLKRPPEDLDAAFDLTATRADVNVRKLVVKAPACRLDAAGRTTLARPFVFDVDVRTLEADLGRVFPLVRPFVPDVGDGTLAGKVAGRATLHRDAAADLKAAGRLEFTDLVATGWTAEEIRRARAAVELDADLVDHGDTLVVRTAEIDDLRGQGTVHFRDGGVRDARGELKGIVAIPPFVAPLAGLDRLAGTATVDLTAHTTGENVRIDGLVDVAGLRVDDVARDRVSVRGHAERSTVWAAKLALDAGGGVTASGTAKQIEGGWSGSVGAEFPLAALADFGLPAGSRGAAGGRGEARFVDGRWWARGSVAVQDLVAPVGERTLRDDRVTAAAEVVQSDEGWAITVSRARLDGHGLDVEVPRALVAPGKTTALVKVRGPLEGMAALAGLDRGHGAAVLTADLVHEDGTRFDARLEVDGFALADERSKRALLVAQGTRKGDTTDVSSFLLTLDRASLKGRATIGAAAEFDVEGGGDFAALARHLPDVAGEGRFTIDAKGSVPVSPRDGPLRVAGTLRVAQAQVRDAALRGAVATTRLEAEHRGDEWKDVSVALVVTAEEARQGDARYAGIRADATGSGAWRADGGGKGVAFRTQVQCREVHAGAADLEDVRIQSAGRTRGKKFPRLRDGDLSFARLVTGPVRWTDARGRFESDGTTVRVTGLEAKVNKGSVTGELEFGIEAPMRWRTHFRANNVELDEELGRPLSLMVPLLRLDKGRAERALQGRVTGEATLAASGRSWDHLRTTMSGQGHFDFYDVKLQGSLVLPLLSLRLDKAVLGRATKFEAFRTTFAIAKGRVKTQPFRLGSAAFSIGIEGECGLDGTLDFLLRPTLPPIPLALKGTWERPKVRPTIRLPFK